MTRSACEGIKVQLKVFLTGLAAGFLSACGFAGDGVVTFGQFGAKDDGRALPWRGYMLDCSRHFFTVGQVKKTLDTMAAFGLNVFHWHLTDSQGWRVEIDRYPELTGKGAERINGSRRASTMWRDDAGGKYGPYFYTKDQIRDIVGYAKKRGIRVVPEIDIPGHSRAAIAAYPELGCEGLPNTAECCVGDERTCRFYENVVDEILELFPDEAIHLGGDECRMANWRTCARCQAKMRREGMKDVAELQVAFTRHFAEYLAKKGRRMVAWGDVMKSGAEMPKSLIVMAYNAVKYGAEAAKRGHDVVMAIDRWCYFDYSQGLAGDLQEYQPFGRVAPVRDIRTFDPASLVPPEARSRVLGSEGCMWTELVPDFRGVEWRTWPRLAALAKVLREGPCEDERAFEDYLEASRAKLLAAGVNCAPLGPGTPDQKSLLDPQPKVYRVKPGLAKMLKNPLDRTVIEWDEKKVDYRRIFTKRDASLAPGAYRLALKAKVVELVVSDDAGIDRALSAIRQMARPKTDGTLEFDACEIED